MMSQYSYLKILQSLAKEVDDNYDMIIEKNKLSKKPAAAKAIPANWPAPVKAFYSEMNGYNLHWRHFNFEDKPKVSGRVNLLPADQVGADGKGLVWFDSTPADSNLRSFRLIDFFVDEAAVGFYDTEDSNGEMHLYMFEADPIPLGVDFKGYIQLLREARGFFYWQQVLVAIRQRKENQESNDFKLYMPQIFPDFKFDDFVKTYKSLKI